MRYDLIIVGGGLAGSALGKSMAERGARVLILERERQFRDRVRGEQVHPWGVAEARALGLYEALAAMGAHEVRWWSTYRESDLVRRRDLVESSPHRAGSLNFYHPSMQETLLSSAATAGAEVRRGVTVTKVSPGGPPTVHVQGNGSDKTYEARLVIGADGRQSRVRHWASFTISQEEKWLVISGVLLDGMKAADDGNHTFRPSSFGQAALLFPLARGRFRAYLATGRRADHRWLRGHDHFENFVTYAVASGAPVDWFSSAKVAGPLATFEAADVWVDQPYKDGVALVGDAALSSDPCFGCGLSLTLRDIRVLRDRLLAIDDWSRAAEEYAAEHDRYSLALRTLMSWLRSVLYGLGAEADRLREHALPRFADGSGPDIIGIGPECPADESARIRFLGA